MTTAQRNDSRRPMALFLVVLTITAAGTLIGAISGTVNGLVDPAYFGITGESQYWHIPAWYVCLEHGALEGLTTGACCALVLGTVIGFVTKERCSYEYVRPHLLTFAAAVVGSWFVGGVLAFATAAAFPPLMSDLVGGSLSPIGGLLRTSWVAGSVWTIRVGTPIALLAVSIRFASHWRDQPEEFPTNTPATLAK